METETTASPTQREARYPGEKKQSWHRLWFFFLVFRCISNMLVHWIAFSLSPLWSAPSKKIWLVNLHLFTSTWIVFNCRFYLINSPKELWVVAFLPPVVSGQKHIYFWWFQTCAKGLKTLFFSNNFRLPQVLWHGYLETLFFIHSFIYLFIYRVSIFYELFNYVTLAFI